MYAARGRAAEGYLRMTTCVLSDARTVLRPLYPVASPLKKDLVPSAKNLAALDVVSTVVRATEPMMIPDLFAFMMSIPYARVMYQLIRYSYWIRRRKAPVGLTSVLFQLSVKGLLNSGWKANPNTPSHFDKWGRGSLVTPNNDFAKIFLKFFTDLSHGL